MKIGDYELKIGRYVWVQTSVPMTIKCLFGFIWIFRKAKIDDVDRKARFPLGTEFSQNGRSYRYYKASANLKRDEIVVK